MNQFAANTAEIDRVGSQDAYKPSETEQTLITSVESEMQNERKIQRISSAIDRERYRVIQRACPTFLDSVRLDSKSWQERKSEIRSKLRFVSDRLVQSASHAVLELTGRTGGRRSITGRARGLNQRVSRFSRRLPLISATDSILALQTRKQR